MDAVTVNIVEAFPTCKQENQMTAAPSPGFINLDFFFLVCLVSMRATLFYINLSVLNIKHTTNYKILNTWCYGFFYQYFNLKHYPATSSICDFYHFIIILLDEYCAYVVKF